MRVLHFFLAILIPVALGNILQRAACNADNCIRAVTGTSRGTATLSSRLQDCSSFQVATIYPNASTITITSGSSSTTITPSLAGTTITAVNVPAFAQTACTPTPSASSRFASACSCAGITRTTVTAATPIATVIKAVTTSNGTGIINAQTCDNPSDIDGGVYNLCESPSDSGCYCFSGTAAGSAYCLGSVTCPNNTCSTDADCSGGQAGLCLVTNCGRNCFYQSDLGQCVSSSSAVVRRFLIR